LVFGKWVALSGIVRYRFFFVFCVFLLEVESVNGVGLIMWKEKAARRKEKEEEK
jgi:hypothetical protein